MGTDSHQPELEDLARQLEESGDYRVLRRLVPPGRYADDAAAPRRTAIALDIETTGTASASDEIIELSVIPFEYSADDGRIFAVGQPLTQLEDPGRLIPPDVVQLTGITDAAVAGKRIDDRAVTALLRDTDFVVSHNAAFDRPFLERRLPVFADVPWACSMVDVPWKDRGYAAVGQEYLVEQHCGVFYDAHRAEPDALAMLHLLATPFGSGEVPFGILLRTALGKSVHIWAVGAPYEAKNKLKARRYSWNPGEDGRPRAWHRTVSEDDQPAELAWLREQVYGGRDGPWRLEAFDPRTRFSARGGA
jgi:DNA polymerase-3 subunit epsilon